MAPQKTPSVSHANDLSSEENCLCVRITVSYTKPVLPLEVRLQLWQRERHRQCSKVALGLLHEGTKDEGLSLVKTDSLLTHSLALLGSMGLLRLAIVPPPKQLQCRPEVQEDDVADLNVEEVPPVVATETLSVRISQHGCLNVDKRTLCDPQMQHVAISCERPLLP